MTNEGTPQRSDPHAQSGALIHSRWRWAAALIGLSSFGAGGTAVFLTEVEAGPVALILAGVVFVFIAMGGRLPTRLKLGDNEVELAAMQDFVTETYENAPPEKKTEELARVAELAESAPQIAGPALKKAGTELSLLRELANAVRANGRLTLSVPGTRGPYDARLTVADEVRAHVVLKSIIAGGQLARTPIVEQLSQVPGDEPILLIVGSYHNLSDFTRAFGNPRVQLLVMNRQGSDEFLVECLNALADGRFQVDNSRYDEVGRALRDVGSGLKDSSA